MMWIIGINNNIVLLEGVSQIQLRLSNDFFKILILNKLYYKCLLLII